MQEISPLLFPDVQKERDQLSGKRLKEEAHIRGWSNRQVADKAGYNTRTGDRIISMIYGGKRRMSDGGFEKLSKAWGVRESYLRGFDNYKTVEEIYNSSDALREKKYQIQLSYLKTIGIELSPSLSLYVDTHTLRECWDILKDCFADEALQDITKRFDMSLPISEFQQKYSKNDVYGYSVKKTVDGREPVSFMSKDLSTIQSELNPPKGIKTTGICYYSLKFSVDANDKNGYKKWSYVLSDTELVRALDIMDQMTQNDIALIFDAMD